MVHLNVMKTLPPRLSHVINYPLVYQFKAYFDLHYNVQPLIEFFSSFATEIQTLYFISLTSIINVSLNP